MENAEHLFTTWNEALEAGGTAIPATTVLFIVNGAQWLLGGIPVRFTKVDTGAIADCSVTLAEDDLLSLARGTLNPQEAFLSGRLALDGSFDKLLLLNPLFSQLMKFTKSSENPQ